jgi:polysulfide reductase chain C
MSAGVHLMGTFATQDRWTVLIIAYLFMGGLGAALLAISTFTERYLRPSPALTRWGVYSGVIILGVGSLLLLFHLLHPIRAWEVLLPWNPLLHPTSWIAWGTQFIIWAMVFGVLYASPHLHPGWGTAVSGHDRDSGKRGLVHWYDRLATPMAWLAILNALGTLAYTGFLLSSFPAVALWHNPVVPALFTVSALSTGVAYLLLVQHLVLRDHGPIARYYERFDIALIGVELLLLAILLFGVLPGTVSGQASYALLMGSFGWVGGFLVLGLLVPLLLEIKGSVRAWNSPLPIVTAAVLVLIGGYLLRHYFMTAGVYYFPWANAHHLGVLGSDVLSHVQR